MPIDVPVTLSVTVRAGDEDEAKDTARNFADSILTPPPDGEVTAACLESPAEEDCEVIDTSEDGYTVVELMFALWFLICVALAAASVITVIHFVLKFW